MCDNLEDYIKKNDIKHQEIINRIKDVAGHSTAEREKLIAELKAMNTSIEAAATMSNTYKTIIGVLFFLLTSVGLVGIFNQDKIVETRVDTYKLLEQINTHIRESNNVVNNLNTKALIDTINSINVTQQKLVKSLLPFKEDAIKAFKEHCTQNQKDRNAIYHTLKDHEKRIKQLEDEIHN